jgi:hypothetical protein
MLLKDLVVEVIKDIVKNGDTSVTAANLTGGLLTNDPQYSDLVNNAIPSINKAINRLVTMRKLPFKTWTVPVVYVASTDNSKLYKQYTLTLPNDFRDIVSIVYVDTKGRLEVVQWQTLSKTSYYLPIKKGVDNVNHGEFIIQYSVTVPFLTSSHYNTDLNTSYNITDEMAQYITLFTRADLWEVEQPQLAQTYRQYAEQYFDQIENQTKSFRQENVTSKYNGDM